MRAFVVSLLLVSAVAASPSELLKKHEKRGLIGHHGSVGDLGVSHGVASDVIVGDNSVGTSGKYLPPTHISVPSTSYGVPSSVHSYSAPVSVSSYDVPAPVSVPLVGLHHAPISTYGVPTHVSASTYDGLSHVPAATYGVPTHVSEPVYSVPSVSVGHPVSVGSSYSDSVSLGSGSLSHGIPVGSAVSLGSVSGSYGVPTNFAHSHGVSGGLSLSSISLPSKSYAVPTYATGYHSGWQQSVPVQSIGVSNGFSDVGSTDGYSYPVPSKKLLI